MKKLLMYLQNYLGTYEVARKWSDCEQEETDSNEKSNSDSLNQSEQSQ